MASPTLALTDLALRASGATDDVLRWEDLGLVEGITIGPLTLRFYALAYMFGILLGYWLLARMSQRPGSPLTRDQVDTLIFAVTIGIILGGRLGYATFYNPELWTSLDLLKVWQGGMSFHGGLIGVLLAVGWVAWREKLDVLRVTDYVATVVPVGMTLGRLANFINGELWGRPGDVPWAMVFPGAGPEPRHPSQLYQAGLEGLTVLVVVTYLFWRTRARWRPGLLAGVFAIGTGLGRFVVEFFREPDAQLTWLVDATGLSMGQWLTIPLVLLGVFLVWRALRRPEIAQPEVVVPAEGTGDGAHAASVDPTAQDDGSGDAQPGQGRGDRGV